MVEVTAVLAASDFLRAPVLAAAEPAGFKEWHHFVVHGERSRILINFSLAYDAAGQAVPKVIVIVHDRQWAGAIERFDTDEFSVSEDLRELRVGGSHMRVGPDGYRVCLDVPGHAIRGELTLVPVSRPFVVNNQPLGAGRMSWLFVPKLHAHGRLEIAGRAHRFHAAPAYHDHNWGRFRWGDDFGWTWGTILPADGSPWSVVFLQMTDRRRLRNLSQALYVWRNDEPAAIFRHAGVHTVMHGRLGRAADCTLPPPMRILLDGDTPGVPERVDITAARAGDTVHAEFRSAAYARLVQPSEVALDRVSVLCETSGTAHIDGTVGGEKIDCSGTGVFEFFYG